jgi:hypothetical protein
MMVLTALFAGIALLILVYVLLPLLKDAYWPCGNGRELAELHRARKEGLWAIADVDEEYEMGKLTEEDYVSLRQSLKSEVIPVLKKERDIIGGAVPPSGNHVGDDLKEDMLREVMRICGTRHSS